MSNNKEAIQKFLNNISNVMLKIEQVGLDQFDKRIENLRQNIESFANNKITSGFVGITSSGKSSLLNIILGTGKKVLKEQSKATTNMIVICSKSEVPSLEIHFEEGEPRIITGDRVLSESIWKYTSEDENPENKYSVKYIKLKLPSFLLEGNIEIADTPGLDAYGHKEHEDLTLREFLPQADLIMYLASIRSPMKEADRKILNKIMDANQRIIFVQTCKGAVVEQSYGEDSSESIEKLLERHKNEFKDSIRPYEKLKNAPIVQVETTEAIKYFRDNDKNAWKSSGLDEFIYITKNVTDQLLEDFLIRNLRKTVNETNTLNKLIISFIEGDSDRERDIEDQTLYLKELEGYLTKIVTDKDGISSKWSEQLNYDNIFYKYERDLSKIFGYRYDYNPLHDDEFMDKVQVIGEDIKRRKDEFLNTIDNAKNRYNVIFDKLGLDVRRTDIQNVTQISLYLPNVQKKRVLDALDTPKSGGSLWKKKEISSEYIDKKKYVDELQVSLKLFFAPLVKHLQWWEHTISFSYVEPLQKKIVAIKDDMKNMKTGGTYNDTQYKQLVDISAELSTFVQEISPVCNIEPLKKKIVPYKKYAGKTIVVTRRTDNKNLLLQLCTRMYEGMFHTYYIKCLSNIANKKHRTVMLIAQDYEAQINFLRRLMRLDSTSFIVLEEIEPPYSLNVKDSKKSGMSNINIKGEFYDEMSFYVLKNDMKSFNAAKDSGLFEKTDVIQIMIEDLHRVASAVTDLKERSLFFDTIKQYKNKLLITYPRAAYFQTERLHILSDEAIVEINQIFAAKKDIQWFIYENFEIRYNFFHELALKIRDKELKPEQCMEKWKSSGIPLDGSFTEDVIKRQFEELVWQ